MRGSFRILRLAMRRLTKNTIAAFHAKIFDWWAANARDLPWRHTSDPYRILVSEVMLQQTQVSRVIPKYEAFLEAFPDARALAVAKTSDVLRLWKGLGYNRRALYLQKAAAAVVSKYCGIFPHDERELKKLPGLGTYTVRAVQVFAFRMDVAMVDTNIRQIIVGEWFDSIPQPEKRIQDVADMLVPKGKSWEWHQALMDYGSLALVRIRPHAHGARTPFRKTDRFLRGRIVDELREHAMQRHDLIAKIVDEWDRSGDDAARVIERLIADGLAIERRGVLSLPE